MQVLIRFLTISAKLSAQNRPFCIRDGATAAELLSAIALAGEAGSFCAPGDWPGLPEQVLLAADARMLRPDEPIREGQQISIIGQMLGG